MARRKRRMMMTQNVSGLDKRGGDFGLLGVCCLEGKILRAGEARERKKYFTSLFRHG
ncbi:MAG: hypothetical protein ACYDCM_04630 [Candidatus Acidiferrales bacterium]